MEITEVSAELGFHHVQGRSQADSLWASDPKRKLRPPERRKSGMPEKWDGDYASAYAWANLVSPNDQHEQKVSPFKFIT